MVNKPVLIFRHPKEIVLFANFFGDSLMIGALAVDQLLFSQKPLTPPAVMAGVFAEIDIILIINLLQECLHDSDMVGIGGADRVIRLNGKSGPGVTEGRRNPVHIFSRADPFFFRGLNDFFAMLVGAGLKTDIITAEPFKAGIGIGDDGGIGMPEMGHGVDIINRSCDIGCHIIFSFYLFLRSSFPADLVFSGAYADFFSPSASDGVSAGAGRHATLPRSECVPRRLRQLSTNCPAGA